jgi:hypothetical protein
MTDLDFNVCAGENGRLGAARKLLKIWCPLEDSHF